MTVVDQTWVTAAAVAAALEVERHTVARWAARGLIPSAERGANGRWRFDPVAVARWYSDLKARNERVVQ